MQNKELDFKNIKLDTLPLQLTPNALKILKEHKVTTVWELITFAIFEIPSNCREDYKRDIYCNAKLLMCKYMNIDPKIDINDELIVYTAYNYYLSVRAKQNLSRAGFTSLEFNKFMLKNEEEIMETLVKFREIGSKTAGEIMFKGKIVADYYRAQQEESFKSLLQELEQIRSREAEIINILPEPTKSKYMVLKNLDTNKKDVN